MRWSTCPTRAVGAGGGEQDAPRRRGDRELGLADDLALVDDDGVVAKASVAPISIQAGSADAVKNGYIRPGQPFRSRA